MISSSSAAAVAAACSENTVIITAIVIIRATLPMSLLLRQIDHVFACFKSVFVMPIPTRPTWLILSGVVETSNRVIDLDHVAALFAHHPASLILWRNDRRRPGPSPSGEASASKRAGQCHHVGVGLVGMPFGEILHQGVYPMIPMIPIYSNIYIYIKI